MEMRKASLAALGFIFTNFFLFMVFVDARPLPKEQKQGRLLGTVLDLNHASVVGAKITLMRDPDIREIITDESGEFDVQLPAGAYRLSITANGFCNFERWGLIITAGATEMINVHLEVGVQDSPDSCKSTALAQAIERSAEEVVRAYWAAMRAQDWAKYVQLIHPKSLSEARQYANLLAKALSELGTGGNLHSYVGVTSLEEFDRLKDRDVLERLMPRLIPSVIAERILKATTFDIVGAAKEKEDIIHILYRGDIKLEDSEGKRLQVVEVEDSGKLVSRHYTIKLPEPNQERIEVLTLKKDGAYWKIILPEEIVEDILSLKDQIDEGKEHLLKFAEVLKAQKKPKPKTKRSTLRR